MVGFGPLCHLLALCENRGNIGSFIQWFRHNIIVKTFVGSECCNIFNGSMCAIRCVYIIQNNLIDCIKYGQCSSNHFVFPFRDQMAPHPTNHPPNKTFFVFLVQKKFFFFLISYVSFTFSLLLLIFLFLL